MTRVDLYTTIHKGLRPLLAGAAAQVARADFSDPLAAAAAVAEVRRALGFLHQHAEHEDAEVMVVLARVAPELFADLRAGHARTGGAEAEVAQLCGRLDAALQPAERLSLGRRLHERSWALLALHLEHMALEETQANRVLWAHLDDEELRAIHGRIVAGIAPARMAEWLELLLPAMNLPERAEMLAGMFAALPLDAFDACLAPARRALGEERWRACLAAAGIARAPGLDGRLVPAGGPE